MAIKRLASILVLSMLGIAMLVPIVPTTVQAASNIRPRPVANKCLGLAQRIGASRVWLGQHIGSRDLDPMFKWSPRKEHFNEIRCFKTRKACENWLYWMRSDFPEFSFHKPCRRGL